MSSGSGSHASSTTAVSLLVANTGSVPLIGSGNVSKYGMGSCAAPCTVAFCSGITVLSRLATEIALIAFPGPDVYQEPFEPSLPVQHSTTGPCVVYLRVSVGHKEEAEGERACQGEDGVHGVTGNRDVPAAIVTIRPEAAILLDSTELELSVQPSVPPRDIVRMLLPSSTPWSSASMRTAGTTHR